jgi:hypothetical protein
MSRLEVLVDGIALPEDEARAFWKRFSDHMEEHRGDLAGFAKAEGLASVRPAMGPKGARLVASRTAPQEPYAPARSGEAPAAGGGQAPGGGGSGRVHGPPKGSAKRKKR